MKWTRNAVCATRAAADHLEMHVMDLFEEWWLKNIYKGEYGSDSINKFYAPMIRDNTGDERIHYWFDNKSREWVIPYDGEAYRFPEEWIYEDLDKEPDVHHLWTTDYYDGPLSGMALYEGQMVWFHCHSFGHFDDEELYPMYSLRTHALIELPERDLAAEVQRHENWRAIHPNNRHESRERYEAYKDENKELFDHLLGMDVPIGDRPNYGDLDEIMIVSDIQLYYK
jgi:hypothetical protein